MSGYVAAVLADAPVHYWRCADPGGSLLHDIGSNPRALQLNNTAIATPYVGPVFDGGSVWFGNNLSAIYRDFDVVVNTPLTIEVWAWVTYSAGVAQDFLSWLTAAGVGPAIGIDSTLHPHLFTPGPPLTAAAPMSVQHWHHMVGTCSAVASLLYVDAIQVASGGSAATTGGSAPMLAAGNLISTPQRLASAFLAEAAIYSSVLSPSRVNAHFLAADATTSRPVSKLAGSLSIATGIPTLLADSTDAVLKAVRKTFTTP